MEEVEAPLTGGRGTYHCRVCGQPKKGHICPGLPSRKLMMRDQIRMIPPPGYGPSMPGGYYGSSLAGASASMTGVSGMESDTGQLWAIPTVENPVEEAALYNARLLTERRQRNPFYWDAHTGSVQCLRNYEVGRRARSGPLPGSRAASSSSAGSSDDDDERLKLRQQVDDGVAAALRQEHLRLHEDRLEQSRFLRYVDSLYPLSSLKGQLPMSMEDVELREPTLPVSAFRLYAGDFFDEAETAVRQSAGACGTSHEPVAYKLAEMWRALGEQERAPFFKQAAESRRKWCDELNAYARSSANRFIRLHPQWNEFFTKHPPVFAEPSVGGGSSHSQSLQSKRLQRKVETTFSCHVCWKTSRSADELLTCETCYRRFHSDCLELSQETFKAVDKLGHWRCGDCKVCELCRDPSYETHLIFCDLCDRGHHVFCVDPPLHKPPEGSWICAHCAESASSTERKQAKKRSRYPRRTGGNNSDDDDDEDEEEEEEENDDDDEEDENDDDDDDDDDDDSGEDQKGSDKEQEAKAEPQSSRLLRRTRATMRTRNND